MSRTLTTRRVLAVGVALALTAAACSDDADGEGVFTGMPGDSPLPEDTEEDSGPGIPDSPEAVADAASEEVEQFWAETFPEVYGGTFEPLSGGWHAYNADTPPPECGPGPMTYEQVAENAFYCQLDDYIAYDDDRLLSWLWDDFGGFAIAIVMAHEYGHAIQHRNDELTGVDSVRIEMQADCMSGAWISWVADGNSEAFDVEVDQLDSAIAGMIAIRDMPGMDPDMPAAHGSGFDRVNALQDGFVNGAERCAEYPDLQDQGDLVVTQIPFSTPEEYETGGNLHLEDRGDDSPGLLNLSVDYLEIFYDRVFEEQLGEDWTPVEDLVTVDPSTDEVTCGGESLSGDELEWFSAYCSDENIVVMDGTTMAPRLFDAIGDFAVGAEVARLWAFAAQEQLGVADDSKEARLQADCLTGYWAGALFPDDQGRTALGRHPDREDVYLSLSAGDLDEAIQSMLAYDDVREEEAGSVFERAAAMRSGVNDGINGITGADTCSQYHPLE